MRFCFRVPILAQTVRMVLVVSLLYWLRLWWGTREFARTSGLVFVVIMSGLSTIALVASLIRAPLSLRILVSLLVVIPLCYFAGMGILIPQADPLWLQVVVVAGFTVPFVCFACAIWTDRKTHDCYKK
jgi:hypothetical protein